MNEEELKFNRQFIIIYLVVAIASLILSGLLFYDSLNRLHSMVFSQYEKIYIQNSKNTTKSVICHIIHEIESERVYLIRINKKELRNKILSGYHLTQFLYDKFGKTVDRKALQNTILKALQNEDRNFMVVDSKGVVLLHPSLKRGANIYNFEDSMGNKIFQFIKESIKTDKNKETFISYYLNTPGLYGTTPKTNMLYRRLVYVKYFEPYKWYIGNIMFYSTIDDRLKKKFIFNLKTFRYGNNDKSYVFVLKVQKTSKRIKLIRVVNPNKPKNAVGKEISLKLKDADGKLFIKDIADTALTSGEGFVHYKFKNPANNKIEEKITFIKYYPKWHWIVGSGFYLDIFRNELKSSNGSLSAFIARRVKTLIVELFILDALLFVVFIIFMNYIMRGFSKYRKQLEESEKFQKNLMESIPNPLIFIDKDGKSIKTNKAFKDFFNVEDVGEKVQDSQILFIKEKIMSYIKDKDSSTDSLNLIDSMGKMRNVELHKSVIFDKDNNPAGAICIIFDVTKQKVIEHELMELSIKDELTDLYNRRHFNMILSREIDRAKRYNDPLSIIIYDIDHFKKINDTYGHQAGDYVLKELSKIVKHNVRSVDFVFRIGGEEFAILLIKTDIDNAYEVAEKIRKQVENHKFKKVKAVTISMGVAQLKKSDTPDSFIKRADMALYNAKESGRNLTKKA